MLMAEKAGLSGIEYEIWGGNPPVMKERFIAATALIPEMRRLTLSHLVGDLILEIAKQIYPDFLYIKSTGVKSHHPGNELIPQENLDREPCVGNILEWILKIKRMNTLL